MAFRLFYEPLNLLGKIVGKDLVGNTGDAVGDFVRNNLEVNPLSFSGSYADLLALISRETDSCANEAKKRGFFTSLNNARASCSDSINAAYAEPLMRLQGTAEAQNQAAKNQFLEGGNTIYIIAAIALILIIFIYLY